jgi:hypothetical protein
MLANDPGFTVSPFPGIYRRLIFFGINYEHIFYVSKFDSMTTLTVEIDKEQDLAAVEAVLNKMGLKFHIDGDDEDEWSDLPEEAIEGIKAGLADVEAGRVHTLEEFKILMDEKIKSLTAR